MNNRFSIKKFIKSIPYHINGAFKSVIRHLAMSISSASAVSITLVLMMIFIVVACNINNFTTNIEQSVQILVRIENSVNKQEDIDKIGEQIKKINGVSKVSFSSKDDELEKYIDFVGGSNSYDSYKGKNNPMLNAYEVDVLKGENLEPVQKSILKIEGVVDAEFGGASAKTMVDAFESVRIGGAIFVLALSALAIFLISNTIKITIYARNTEISIMRSVGATNGFIKMPFMIEGMIIGLMGSIFPILLTCFGYSYLYGMMNGYMLSSMFPLILVTPFVVYVSIILALTGMLVGLIGSLLSVNKYLKWKR